MTRNTEDFFKIVDVGFMVNVDQVNHPVRLLIAENALELGARSVLDVACNVCLDHTIMSSRELEYHGIDFESRFIDKAHELYPGIDAQVASAYSIPFDDGSIDVVYCKDLLEHLAPISESPNYQDAVKEMWRVANKAIMISFFHPPQPGREEISWHDSGFWNNTYNRDEIDSLIDDLPGAYIKSISVTDNVGIGSPTLYAIQKGDL